MEIKLYSPAKINVGLDIINKRQDNYHNIDTIMEEIPLYDKINFKKTREGFLIRSSEDKMPRNEDNLMFKAFDLLRSNYQLEGGLEIDIEKNIPMGAGLGGGSSNCASCLKAVNQLWDLDLSDKDLEELASGLGADVPFFIRGGRQRARGIGQVLETLDQGPDWSLILINPKISISTEEVYKKTKGDKFNKINMDKATRAYLQGDRTGLGQIENIMEETVFEIHKDLRHIKEDLKGLGGDLSLMTGSGSSFFSGFLDQEAYEVACKRAKEVFKDYQIIRLKKGE